MCNMVKTEELADRKPPPRKLDLYPAVVKNPLKILDLDRDPDQHRNQLAFVAKEISPSKKFVKQFVDICELSANFV